MHKAAILLFLIVFLGQNAIAQKTEVWYEFDTLQVQNDTVLVHFKDYKDSVLYREGQALVFKDLSNDAGMQRIEFHGRVWKLWKDGKYSIGEYRYGNKVSMKYYDVNNNEISREAIFTNYRSHSDPEKGVFYLIDGAKLIN
jgi:hypothetical protein